MGRSRRPPRLVTGALLAVTAALLVAALITDVQAHTRARHEQHLLEVARTQLSARRGELNAASHARRLATVRRNTLAASVVEALGQLSTKRVTLTTTNTAAYLQGLDIGTLRTCLGGVQGALGQIAADDNARAGIDLSSVATACMTLDGGPDGGLVYPFDFPDPFVLRDGSRYFAYATNSAEGNIQIIESSDLLHWSAVGNALPNLPKWASRGGTWAPSVLQVGSTFVLYYSAIVAGPGVAAQPAGPFLDHSAAPLVCQSGLGGSIDPSPFVDANGTPYLEWKSNGGDGRPATLWSEALNATGTGLAGPAPTPMLTADQGWEAGVVEAPDLVFAAGHYFLFYSGNNWNSAHYAIGVTACSGPLGPCADQPSQPILASGPSFEGPGGETVFTDGAGTLWMAFHAWLPGAVGYPHSRALYLRQLTVSG
jgi:type II secretory pathway pseudopilin PulG